MSLNKPCMVSVVQLKIITKFPETSIVEFDYITRFWLYYVLVRGQKLSLRYVVYITRKNLSEAASIDFNPDPATYQVQKTDQVQ